jgi:hypothetical protein
MVAGYANYISTNLLGLGGEIPSLTLPARQLDIGGLDSTMNGL